MKHLEKQIGAFEAKTHFSEILAAVAIGEEFIITRHGQKIAKLVPFPEDEQEKANCGGIRAIKKLRTGITLGKKLNLKNMREEGRK